MNESDQPINNLEFNYIGPCNPNMFVGRGELISKILTSSNGSFAVGGPRRIGKTSLLFKLKSESVKSIYFSGNFYPLYLDCSVFNQFSDIASQVTRILFPKDFLKSDISKHFLFDNLLVRFKGLRGKIPLLLLDELDWLISKNKFDSEETIQFFNFVRSAYNQNALRVVITGFRHIYEMVRNANHPLYNMCEPIVLSMLDKQEVAKLIALPLKQMGIKLEPEIEIISRIYGATAGHPSLVQFVGAQILQYRTSEVVSFADVDRVLLSEELAVMMLDLFVMNTSPLEKLVCALIINLNRFNLELILKLIKKEAINFSEIDRKIYTAIQNMEVIGILRKDKAEYQFSNPIMQAMIREQYLSPIVIHMLKSEVDEKFATKNAESEINLEPIIRAINFPPEYQQAGLSIINYFGDIVRQKYPEINVDITIQQKDLKVTMIIETPEGDREIIERALDEYGLVIVGKKNPEHLLSKPNHVLALKHKLEMANMEIRHSKELLYIERSQFEKRIASLEHETQRLYKLVGNGLQSNQALIQIISASFKSASSNTKKALKLLEEKLLKGIKESDETEIKSAFETIKKDKPGLFQQIYDLIVKGSISGAAGNYLYEWITTILRSLPK